MPPVIAAIGAIVVTLETTTVLGVSLASIVVGTALSAGLSLISQLLAPGQNKPKPHAQRENIRQAVAPRVRYYGRVKVGGVFAFLKVGVAGWSKFANPLALYEVIALAQGEFDEIEESWLSDAKVTVDADDIVTVPKSYNWSDGNYVKLKTHTGTNFQGADGIMTSNWPGQWTDDFTGLGVPYAMISAVSPEPENFTNVYPAGLPTYSAVARTSKVWDPRDNTQDPDSPGTWKWSSNGVLCVLDVLWNADGVRLPRSMIEAGIDVWKMEADYCDTIRLTKNGGSEKWYRLAGGYQLTDPPKNWLPKMLDPMDARLGLRGDGAVIIDVGRWRAPELAISDEHIVAYTNLSRGRPKADVHNQINATFVSPDYGYVQQQADPLLNEASVDVDGLQSATLDLDWCPSHSQARVRMKIESYREDPDGWIGTIVTKAYGLKFLTANADGSRKRFVHFAISELGIDDDFEVQRWSFDPKSGNCTFSIVPMSSAAFDWNPAVDEGTAPGRAKDTSASGVEDPYNLQISVAGGVITATLDPPLNTALNLDLDYRTTNDAVGDDDASWTALTQSGWGGHTGTLASGYYDVRAMFHNSAAPPDYSDPLIIRGIPIA